MQEYTHPMQEYTHPMHEYTHPMHEYTLDARTPQISILYMHKHTYYTTISKR